MILELMHEFLHTKVIAISGVGWENNVLDIAKLFGARQTFQKPFSMPQLLDAVRYELDAAVKSSMFSGLNNALIAPPTTNRFFLTDPLLGNLHYLQVLDRFLPMRPWGPCQKIR